MMAFALGLDPLFVGAHHLARFFLISLALPFVARRIGGADIAPGTHASAVESETISKI